MEGDGPLGGVTVVALRCVNDANVPRAPRSLGIWFRIALLQRSASDPSVTADTT